MRSRLSLPYQAKRLRTASRASSLRRTPRMIALTRLDALDDRARAEASAAAHRHEADRLVGALELVQERRDQAGARGAERMPERDRAAVHVHPVHVRLELPAP